MQSFKEAKSQSQLEPETEESVVLNYELDLWIWRESLPL